MGIKKELTVMRATLIDFGVFILVSQGFGICGNTILPDAKGEPPIPITIKGKILLPTDKDVTFPEGSFLIVSCDDISASDGPSVNLERVEIDVSNKSSKNDILYTLKANPILGVEISISAFINMGWKGDFKDPKGDWIRKGDYHNEFSHHLRVKKGVTSYEEDIAMVQYKY